MLRSVFGSAWAGWLTAFVLAGGQVPGQRPVHAHVSLISSTPGFPGDGSETTVALRFTIDDGWRISWKNLGGSGGAPVVTWDVPRTAATFFPAQDRVIDDAATPTVETTPKGFVLHVRAATNARPLAILEGVIVLPRRGAFTVTCTLNQPRLVERLPR